MLYKFSLRKPHRLAMYILVGLMDLGMMFYIGNYIYEKWLLAKWLERREQALNLLTQENLNDRAARLEKTVAEYSRQINLNFDNLDLVKILTEKARLHHLKDLKIEQLPAKPSDKEKKDTGRMYIFRITTVSAYPDIWAFLRDLETLPMPVVLYDVQMAHKEHLEINLKLAAESPGIGLPFSEQITEWEEAEPAESEY